MKADHKIIKELVDENFVYAKILHYFGVDFYENREKTLHEVCAENNIEKPALELFMDGINSTTKLNTEQLSKYPAGLIVQYLKHSHQIFIKDKLTYILKLVNAIEGESKLIDDLKFVLPIFVEDFIRHIYEEEDTLFSYINQLEAYLKNPSKFPEFTLEDNEVNIQEFAMHHENSDQEILGIKGITHNYDADKVADVHLKVILQELQHFDELLSNHAKIENDILFPKAILLEKYVMVKMKNTVAQN